MLSWSARRFQRPKDGITLFFMADSTVRRPALPIVFREDIVAGVPGDGFVWAWGCICSMASCGELDLPCNRAVPNSRFGLVHRSGQKQPRVVNFVSHCRSEGILDSAEVQYLPFLRARSMAEIRRVPGRSRSSDSWTLWKSHRAIPAATSAGTPAHPTLKLTRTVISER